LPKRSISASAKWGYGRHENLTSDDLIDEKYRIRPAAGYPPAPITRAHLWQLLDVEKNTECSSPSCAMCPAA
jgi:5-methyltetrahydrofolate--homocysteine methyltransferase